MDDSETALYCHPRVNEVAAIYVSDKAIENRIEAFVIIYDKGLVNFIGLNANCSEIITKDMFRKSFQFCDILTKIETFTIDRPVLEKI